MDTTEGIENAMPAYNVSAWQVGCLHANYSAPQCSAAGEFCFFCEYRDDGGPCQDMKALAKLLISQGKELPVVVRTVQDQYNETAREDVVCKHPITGAELVAPEWTLSSIQKHLLFSNEFSKAFSKVVENQFTSVIMHLNAQMIDSKTKKVIESTRKAWVDTVKAFKMWKESK